MKARMILLILFLLAFLSVGFAQHSSQPHASALHLNSDLNYQFMVHEVSLVVTVTDPKGHFVRNLAPSDLQILDNNARQSAVTFFQSETDLPMDVAFVLDTSASVAYRFPAEQSAVSGFIHKVIRPFDSVMLFAFNQDLQFEAPIQNNWNRIYKRVRKLKPAGETAIYDAVCGATQWFARDQRPARRIMILISDGEENSSRASLDDAIRKALKADTSIYTVNVGDDRYTSDGKEGEHILKMLSDATGGNYMVASMSGDVSHAFSNLQHELRSQYAVAYRPSNLTGQMFHRIQIVAPHNLRLRYRTGYYARNE